MTNEEIIREFNALPLEARREVEDFITFLNSRHLAKSEKTVINDLPADEFVGMWKDRDDLSDGPAWVRNIRQREWSS